MAITTNNLISRQTVGSAGAASVTFSNIPATFTDLNLVFSARNSDATAVRDFRVQFNSDTAANYFNMEVYGISGSAGSGSNTTNQIQGACNADTSTASLFTNISLYVPNYASSNHKSISIDNATENNSTSDAQLRLIASKWSNTAAITSIQITTNSGNYMQYSTFSLYGISSNTSTQNTSVPSATGGDVITTDGTYWYHAFKYSGTFTPLKALTADYLVVAGGGGGGSPGGGAGGYRTSIGGSALSLTAQAYTCTVGAGGTTNTQGSNSVFSTITSTGGGTGNGAGGSGGGGDPTPGAGNQGSYSPVEGYAGGNGATYGPGGGGGSSAVGGAGTGSSSPGTGGVGGAGTSNSISGSAVTYAGGGGGAAGASGGVAGLGGAGGGGRGESWTANNSVAGTANTGGGGGGGWSNVGKTGGSGIVIVRYAV